MPVLVLLGVWAPSASGQQIEEQERRAERERSALESSSDASREAELFELADEEDAVTYAEVLADPDNVPLNFRYALAQIRQKNLRGASTTLERILLVEPDLPRVRLLYAIVLFRLGNIDEAERELHAVSEQNPSRRVRTQVDDYLGRISRLRRRTRYDVAYTMGAQIDSNRNAAPQSGAVLFRDQVIPLASRSKKNADVATRASSTPPSSTTSRRRKDTSSRGRSATTTVSRSTWTSSSCAASMSRWAPST